MNHFEILGISQSETDDNVIAAAYTQARIKWQTILNQGVGKQQQQAREWMNGKLEDVYETLRNPIKRQQYLRELKLSQETGVPIGNGRARVSFSLRNGHTDHEFLVVENPVRHALQTDGLSIGSLQEYVCRAWEAPEWALPHIDSRTLERWIHYSAAQHDIITTMNYLRWESPSITVESILGTTLDLMQTKYPTPILPRSPSDLLARISEFETPKWRVVPSIVNFGVLSDPTLVETKLRITSWLQAPQQLLATVDHPAVKLDTSRLAIEHVITLSVDFQAIERGKELQANVTISCEPFGRIVVPVLATRANRMLGNKELHKSINDRAGKAAMQVGDQRTAAHYLRLAEDYPAAAQAEIALIYDAYTWHDWQRVIDLGRRFYEHYGRMKPDVQLWVIEALRMLSGVTFQLGEHRRSLEYLAALAHETSQLQDKQKLVESWTSQPEANLQIDLDNPKTDWVAIAERYGLNWTHPTGRADGSRYAGEVPLDLSARRIIWRTRENVALKPPLIAYEGVVVGRTLDNRRIVGLDAASGKVIWSHQEGLNGSETAVPVAGDNFVFVADPKGGVYGLDIISGSVKWRAQLGDGRDIALAYDSGIVYVGAGRRFVLLDAENGKEVGSLNELRSFMTDANPVNLLVTNQCCLFQMVGGVAPTMMFLDSRSGDLLQFEMPFVGHSLVKSLFRSVLGMSSGAAITWAAWGEIIVMPYLITKEIECRQQYVDSEGRKKEKVERRQWDELHFFVYAARSDQQVAHTWEVVDGTAYEEGSGCKIQIQQVRAANACAITPTYVEIRDGVNVFGTPGNEEAPHLLIAAAFDRDIYYWLITDEYVKRVGYRLADSNVQSIAYLGLYDMVTTQNSLMTSFIGNVTSGNATAFIFPNDLGVVVGSPAIYGDLIYVTTQSGEVAAIGR